MSVKEIMTSIATYFYYDFHTLSVVWPSGVVNRLWPSLQFVYRTWVCTFFCITVTSCFFYIFKKYLSCIICESFKCIWQYMSFFIQCYNSRTIIDMIPWKQRKAQQISPHAPLEVAATWWIWGHDPRAIARHYLHLATSEPWCWSATVLCTIILLQGTSSSYRSVDCIGLWSCLV